MWKEMRHAVDDIGEEVGNNIVEKQRQGGGRRFGGTR